MILHNFEHMFSFLASGFVMGVSSIGLTQCSYEESDTFLSTNASVTWTMVCCDAHTYEFGDQGNIIVAVNDKDPVDFESYLTDLGKTWCMLHPFLCFLPWLMDLNCICVGNP
jgi:hypothetical protein